MAFKYQGDILANTGTLRGADAVIGADPGGAELIRVGGGARIAGAGVFTGQLFAGGSGTVTQSTPALSARGYATNGNALEWGHGNPAGLGSTLGYDFTNGNPWLAFNAEAGTTPNTYRTRGIKGVLVRADLAGGMAFYGVSAANADNQAPSLFGAMRADGSLVWGVDPGGAEPVRVGGAVRAASVRSAVVFSDWAAVLVANVTPTTVLTLPAVSAAMYIVFANLPSAPSSNSAMAFITAGTLAATFTLFGQQLAGGVITALAVDSSGNVSVTQNSGLTQTVQVNYVRIM